MSSGFFSVKKLWVSALITTMMFFFASGSALSLTLSRMPLFITNKVPPNVFFILDDSGSMNWAVMLNKGTYSPGGFSNTLIDFSPDNVLERRELCAGFNILAYNPNFHYTPWRGKNSKGREYTNRTLKNALDEPYQNKKAAKLLVSHRYFEWHDADGDDEYDGPATSNAKANYDLTDECNVPNIAAGIRVKSLPLIGTPAAPNSQQNYANWYTYFRKREYIAKRAISEFIWNADGRMGLATLNNNKNVGMPIKDMSVATNRHNLLDKLGQVDSAYGTPLRVALRNVGEYFNQAGSNILHQRLGFTDASPILPAEQGGACQQNFAIVFSDGYWNGPNPGVGNTDTDGAGQWDGGSYADTYSNTLADVAMEYYETDLASTLSNDVPTKAGVDENDAQHLVTYTVAFGVSGGINTSTKGTDAEGNPADRHTAFAWPEPVPQTSSTVDDMRHAAWNARGQYFSAATPRQLIDLLTAAVNDIANRAGSTAAVTFTSPELTAGTQVFLTEFNTQGWRGDVFAYNLDSSSGELSTTPAWSAQSVLDARRLDLNQRTLYTYHDDGVLFDWQNLDRSMQDDLRTNPDGTTSTDAVAQARMAFIAGDRSDEGAGSNNNFRPRRSRLGDFVHSIPRFVGAPEQDYPETDPFGTATARYSTYKNNPTYQNRAEVVYVSSNDGMLHGFSSVNGEEILAYIPSFLASTDSESGLHYLTDPKYHHRYYADGTAVVDDVYIKTTANGTQGWKTVLVSNVRSGGRGVFALDISNPSQFTRNDDHAKNTVMWEFDSQDDADLGFSFGEPSIVMLNNHRWATISSNGYNNSGSGEASIFILLLEGGLDQSATTESGAWSQGLNYFKLSTGVGSPTNLNWMSSVTAVDLDGNGTMDRLYSGDIVGNLWVFDISSSVASNWGSAYKDGFGNPKPLFTAASNQPITVKPDVVRLPDVATTPQNSPNVMVYFGTGKYVSDNDKSTTYQQAFYAVWDAGKGELTAHDLVQQTLVNDPANMNTRSVDSPATVVYKNAPVKGTDHFGWHVDFLESGERLTVDPVVRGRLVFFPTMIPDDSTCSPGGGSSYLNAFTLDEGADPPDGAFDVNFDGVVDVNDKLSTYVHASGVKFAGTGITTGMSFLGNNKMYITHTGGNGSEGGVTKASLVSPNPRPGGRLSWQEIVTE